MNDIELEFNLNVWFDAATSLPVEEISVVWIKLSLWIWKIYSGLNLNQDKATKPKTVQIVRQGEATPYRFKVKLLY